MAAATATGTMVPAVPFFLLTKTPALIVAVVAALVLSSLIGAARHKSWKGFVQTYLTIALAGGLSAVVALAVPAGAGG
jgi:hypothetical protein